MGVYGPSGEFVYDLESDFQFLFRSNNEPSNSSFAEQASRSRAEDASAIVSNMWKLLTQASQKLGASTTTNVTRAFSSGKLGALFSSPLGRLASDTLNAATSEFSSTPQGLVQAGNIFDLKLTASVTPAVTMHNGQPVYKFENLEFTCSEKGEYTLTVRTFLPPGGA